MCVEHEEPQHLQIVFLRNLTHGKEVAKRFGHLAVVNVQKCVMHPIFGKNLAIAALTLRNLIFMMREDQILSACMDVDLLAKILLRHDGALDMPARTAITPRRLPGRLSLFFRLPQHEIQRILLLILTGHEKGTVACAQVIQILMRKLSIILELSGTEIDSTIHIVCVAFIDQRLNHVDHTVDLLCGKRMRRRRLHIHATHIFFTFCDVTLGNLLGTHALLVGLCDDLIVHIREIRYIIHLIPTIFHIATHGVEYDHRTCISDMNEIVNGRSTHVHAYFARLERNELFFSLRLCIKNSHFAVPFP